ncbi:MAG: 23S rRNA (adenine(2503)-C(2))-methyltransferase RlmN [Bacteroidales bacterium]|nr:23S rRNA (adenine(2503)-C(2))-methyltransferase RlmN [Bacteroidales bacterium]MDD4529548.1 23S rRNA (adenine(2503)-C(2))-methyltransferase RlmN [Bacteroidales bacterium]
MKESLLGKTLEELQDLCLKIGLPKFTAKQIADWIYLKGVADINSMTNLSLKARELLSEKYEVGLISPIEETSSDDGTSKYLYKYDEDVFVETVMIPDKSRVTLCVSTQAGCKMNCKFCATGKQGFKRNLSAGEIINFVRSLPEFDELSNIVYMGMGEPFDNYNEVIKSINILTSDWGFAMSPRRITVSSSGIIPKMIDFIYETQCNLAISMHNPFHEERMEIMPIEKKYPIEEVCDEIRKHNWYGQRRVTFEYIVWKGINDTYSHAKEISYLLRGIECRVNLIRYHQTPEFDMEGADEETMQRFQEELENFHLPTTIRASRGEDILAACGLLSTKKLSEDK